MSSRRAAVVAVVVAVLAGLVGVLVGSKMSSGTGAAERGGSREPTVVGEADPVVQRDVSDVALAYAELTSRAPYLEKAAFEAELSGLVAPDAGDEVDRITAGVDRLRKSVAPAVAEGDTVWWTVKPLAVRVSDEGTDRASVSVWSVSVKSAAGVWDPVTAFMLMRVELERTGEGWKVFSSATEVRDAPAPLLAVDHVPPVDAAAFAESLSGFELVETDR